ncbi:MAG TPA: polysaccharide biosynthesis/export family protein, partial [Candidatus Dormibacteraeota bacterium]|nr:polysaccharide biosynthesis/export family protein [Candidatus Dormibacteraeota bacterium]
MRILILVFFAGCLAVGSARGQNRDLPSQEKETAKSTSAQTTVAAKGEIAGAEEYKIGPQDVLKIDVWKEEQLTRTVPVRPDGKITLPLLNDVQAAGITPVELARVIRDGLKKYINDPQVTVTVTEINSRRIYVTGEVMRAG